MAKILNASVTGRRHTQADSNNQDAVFSDTQSGITFISLADGAGSLKGGEICAGTVVREVSAGIADNFSSLLNMDSAQASGEISRYILRCLKSLSAGTGLPAEQLGSTYLFAGTDGENIIIVHLGDGAVLGKNDSGAGGVISTPEGSDDGRATFLTCSPDLADHVRIITGNICDYAEVILLSDGMLSAAFNEGFVPKYNTGNSYQQLLEKAVLDMNDDDASYIIMRSDSNGK